MDKARVKLNFKKKGQTKAGTQPHGAFKLKIP